MDVLEKLITGYADIINLLPLALKAYVLKLVISLSVTCLVLWLLWAITGGIQFLQIFAFVVSVFLMFRIPGEWFSRIVENMGEVCYGMVFLLSILGIFGLVKVLPFFMVSKLGNQSRLKNVIYIIIALLTILQVVIGR